MVWRCTAPLSNSAHHSQSIAPTLDLPLRMPTSSIHSVQGRNFASKIFIMFMQSLEIKKTRTTAFRPQFNAVIEQMNRTLEKMLAQCLNDEQNNWSTQLPYVMTAYRSSVDVSTGYSTHFLVYGRKTCLPIEFMYPRPNDHLPSSTNDSVSPHKVAFQKTYESARPTFNQSQKGEMRCVIEKSMDPSTKKDKRYYSTPQLYQLLDLQSSSVLGRANISSHRTSYREHADQQVTGGSLWPFEAVHGTPI